MRKKYFNGGLILMVMVAAGGIWLWNWVLGDTEEASGPIQAVPLRLEVTETAATVDEETQIASTQPASEADEEDQSKITTSATGLKVFEIDQAGSEVRFTIFEELLGQPNNVVGVTDQVSGEVAVDFSDLSTAQVGDIRVNARTLVTDNNRRNQAIRNRILFTNDYELITFSKIMIMGLDRGASPGETFQFQIAGELTIKDTTNPVVFDVTAEMVSENRIVGSATTSIQRNDFDLAVPNVPNVANVGEEVSLKIDFVANTAASTSN